LNADVVVALVGVAGVVVGAVVGLYGQARSASQARRREAEAVLAKYQEPLVHAAYGWTTTRPAFTLDTYGHIIDGDLGPPLNLRRELANPRGHQG
jgi:hypothetical protein